MSGGQNHDFMTLKQGYLNRPLTVGFIEATMPSDPGIYDFDIQRRGMAGTFVYEVIGYTHRAKGHSRFAERIRAYWLPWKTKKSVPLDIGNDADYFFTSELNGCQFRLAAIDGDQLRAIHIAGDSINSALPEGSQWRCKQGNALVREGGGDKTLSRRLSSSIPFGQSGTDRSGAFFGYQDEDISWTNVFGFRVANGLGVASWEFHFQTVSLQDHGFVATATQMWP